MFRSYFRGPLEGKEAPIRHRWAVSTTSLRILQLFGQHDVEGGISGEAKGPNPGSTFECTANFANLVIESYFPEKFYRHIPSMLSSNALVTWDDTSAQPLWMLKEQAAKENRRIKIAHLHTLNVQT